MQRLSLQYFLSTLGRHIIKLVQGSSRSLLLFWSFLRLRLLARSKSPQSQLEQGSGGELTLPHLQRPRFRPSSPDSQDSNEHGVITMAASYLPVSVYASNVASEGDTLPAPYSIPPTNIYLSSPPQPAQLPRFSVPDLAQPDDRARSSGSSTETYVEMVGIGTPSFSEVTGICPIAPEKFQRYHKEIFVDRGVYERDIAPLTTSFARESPLGWTACLHPEGALYFFHEEKRIFTDADLCDPRNLSIIEKNIESIADYLRSQGISFEPSVNLVLDLVTVNEKLETRYYYVDHSTRSIFFLDDFLASSLSIWMEVEGADSLPHLGHAIEAQYWLHCEYFPKSLELTRKVVDELRDIIVHAIADTMTSSTSTAPYGRDDLNIMLTLVNSMKKNLDTRLSGSTCTLSRLMNVFVKQRFYNFHGEPSARLDRVQSIHSSGTPKRTFLIKMLSPILFSAPDIHLRTLEKLWIDQIMHHTIWTQTMNKLNTEWQEFILYATVLLNANVAFLAIQSVDLGPDTYRSPTQIASYLSILSSIGSIILGLLLVRQNRTKSRDNAAEAAKFLNRRSHPTMGLEALAIMYSLPYALLMWGMVSFLAAFSLLCFQESNVATRVLVGTAWVAVGVLIVWCIWMAWERQDEGGAVSGSGSDGSDKGSGYLDHKGPRWLKPGFFRRRSKDSDSTTV